MQQLTNEEIARVFSLYFGLPKSIRNIRWDSSIPSMESFIPNNNVIKDWRLLLTPLSAITDEHAIEVAKMCEYDIEKLKLYYGIKPFFKVRSGNLYVTFIPEKERNNEELDWIYISTQAYLFLITEGYAVPLFLGINHWANGKTAIKLKIAIDKTIVK